MMSVHDLLRERLLKRAGLVELPPPRFTLADLERTQWHQEFERFMRNRLIMGALRYGLNFTGDPKKAAYDRVGSAAKRLNQYVVTGNDELLVDVANLMMLEFAEGNHHAKHFRAGDDGEHVTQI